jgi:aminopeptidase N
MTKIAILLLTFLSSQSFAQSGGLDVKSYTLHLEPNIGKNSIKGVVGISFTIDDSIKEVVFDAGDLQILEVKGESVVSFKKEDKKLHITLNSENSSTHIVEIKYQGNPKYGINFGKEKGEIYTVFSTSQWMVCNDDPSDRASINMHCKW